MWFEASIVEVFIVVVVDYSVYWCIVVLWKYMLGLMTEKLSLDIMSLLWSCGHRNVCSLFAILYASRLVNTRVIWNTESPQRPNHNRQILSVCQKLGIEPQEWSAILTINRALTHLRIHTQFRPCINVLSLNSCNSLEVLKQCSINL